MTSQLPARREPTLPMQEWESLKRQADVYIKSGLAPATVHTPEQAMIIAAQGRELGVPFMASMRSINVIQNRPALSAQLKLALAMNTGELEDFKVVPGQDEVVAEVKRKGRDSSVRSRFGVKEAKSMKLIGKDNYEKQPMTMYQWRALSAALDLAFADVLLGIGTQLPISDDSIPDIHQTQVVDTGTINDEPPTAAQEVVMANQEKTEQEKSVQNGGTSDEVQNLIKDIEEKLGSMNRGDEQAMSDHLRILTTWHDKTTKEEKWLTLEDLAGIARHKPSWLLGIHKKVKAEFEKRYHPELTEVKKHEELPL